MGILKTIFNILRALVNAPDTIHWIKKYDAAKKERDELKEENRIIKNKNSLLKKQNDLILATMARVVRKRKG